MPTAYTAAVVDGSITELKPFALQCARAMGALIMMRDEPWDAPIPERFEPSTYHADKIEAAIAERQRLYNMTDADADAAARAEDAERLAAKKAWQAEKLAERNRYQSMIAKVVQWQKAPDGLKEFMLEQLHSGMKFDCGSDHSFWNEPEMLTGAEWRATKLDKVQRDIDYHSTEDAKERARTEGRNAWIAQLRASLAAMEAADLDGGE